MVMAIKKLTKKEKGLVFGSVSLSPTLAGVEVMCIDNTGSFLDQNIGFTTGWGKGPVWGNSGGPGSGWGLSGGWRNTF